MSNQTMSFWAELLTCRTKYAIGVLQEYARSGVLRSMCVVGNPQVEEILENSLTAANYYDKLNELIGYTYHMVNVFNRTKPVLDNKIENSPATRIYTIGMVDFESGEEKVFFSY